MLTQLHKSVTRKVLPQSIYACNVPTQMSMKSLESGLSYNLPDNNKNNNEVVKSLSTDRFLVS